MQFDQKDQIIIVAAGPSTSANIKKIATYRRDAIMIASNYNYGIKADYTVFTNQKIFKTWGRKATGKLVVGKSIKTKNAIVLRSNEAIQNVDKINIHSDGYVNHTLGNCGYASIIFGTFFNPREMLVVGFDGPTKSYKEKHFNNQTTSFKDGEIRIPLRIKMLKSLISYIINRGINLYTFKSDKLWGINKKKYGVLVKE